MNGDLKKVNNNIYNYTNGLLTSINSNLLTYTNTYYLHEYLRNTYNFTNGRLTSFIDSNNNTYFYEYNYRGLRTKKIFNNNIINYYHDESDRLILEERNNIKIYYIYILDELIGFMYNNNIYYYLKDIEKRIVGIVSGTSVVAKYQYSAYGVIIYFYEESFISGINKFFYKSYYYDSESNMYYLKNRYYSLDILRFISPDNYNYLNLENHTNYNLYAYSNNNPIIYYDPEGNEVLLAAIIIGALIGGAIGFGIAAYNDYKEDGIWFNGDIGNYVGYTFIGAVLGAIAGATIGGFGSMSFSCSFTTYGLVSNGGALSIASTGTMTVTVTGAQILTVAGVVAGATIMAAKGFGSRIGHNQHENQQWKEAMKQLGVKNKDLQRRLHNEIHKYEYQDSLKKLINKLKEILEKWGYKK